MSEDPGPDAPDEPTRAKDGLPSAREETANELAERRAKREGKSVAERSNGGEEVAEAKEEDDGQWTFEPVEEDGKTVTLGQLVRRGTPTEVRYKMTGKSIPSVRGGIMDPYAQGVLLVVDAVVDDVDTQYVRDGNQRIEKVIHYVSLKPRIVQNAATEAGQALLRGEPASHPQAAES